MLLLGTMPLYTVTTARPLLHIRKRTFVPICILQFKQHALSYREVTSLYARELQLQMAEAFQQLVPRAEPTRLEKSICNRKPSTVAASLIVKELSTKSCPLQSTAQDASLSGLSRLIKYVLQGLLCMSRCGAQVQHPPFKFPLASPRHHSSPPTFPPFFFFC